MHVLGEHFHALRKCFVSFGQSVDSLVDCHAVTVYTPLRIVKNYIYLSFIALQSAA